MSAAIHDLIDAIGGAAALFDAGGRLLHANAGWRAGLPSREPLLGGRGAGGSVFEAGPWFGETTAIPEVCAIRLKTLWLVVAREMAPALEPVVAPNLSAGMLIDGLASEASRCVAGTEAGSDEANARLLLRMQQIRLVAQLMAGRPAAAASERMDVLELLSECIVLPIAPKPRVSLWQRSVNDGCKIYGDRLQLMFAIHVFLEAIVRESGEPATVLLDIRPHGSFVLVRAVSQAALALPSDATVLPQGRAQHDELVSMLPFSWDARRDLAERILAGHGGRWNLAKIADEGAVLELPTGSPVEEPRWEAPLLAKYAEDLRRALAARA